ncbi:Tn3 family transposase [Streptomyces sp. 5-10]|nr:Tn3 family transposase [Streptomyces sp. 5-10]MBD3003940.1 Tn3 family transposase [Streptomyces sp. 5-10]
MLGESKALEAASAGKRVLAGVRGLPALARRKVGVKPLLPREVDDKLVPPAWRKAVYANPDLPQGAVDRDAYVVCVTGAAAPGPEQPRRLRLLPDLLFEVNAWTGFLDAFVHLGDGTTRMKDLSTSVVALLVPEACNIGLAPVVNPGYEALTRARLVHVDQYYLRADTIAAANAALIEARAAVPIVKFWGEGLLASVDGLRFVVPVRTVSAAPWPKYFGFKRGITWLNAVNDQVAGIGQMVVPGTPRDSLYILDVLLNLDGGVKPEMVATDNASYSDMVFGLFKILGYNFSPRFRDLDDQRFWRATMPGVETGTYGAVEDLARNRVNLNKVITHWPDMLMKVAASLVTNQIRAYDLLRMLGRDGRPAPLGVAFAEYGRIAKTEHLLRVVDPVDDTYRRQMNRQLTAQERTSPGSPRSSTVT